MLNLLNPVLGENEFTSKSLGEDGGGNAGNGGGGGGGSVGHESVLSLTIISRGVVTGPTKKIGYFVRETLYFR